MAEILLWMLLLSPRFFQDALGDTNGTCREDNAMVQLRTEQSGQVSTSPGWDRGTNEENCVQVCASTSCFCDVTTMRTASNTQIEDAFTAWRNSNPGQYYWSPLHVTTAPDPNHEKQAILTQFADVSSVGWATVLDLQPDRATKTTCEQNAPNLWKRFCYCTPVAPVEAPPANEVPPANEAVASGDPHIHTFRDSHYTLLRQGIFRAWTLKKEGTDLELLASYVGPRFTTQGLLLKDMSGVTMEMTAKNCAWHMLGGDGTLATQFEVHGAREHKEFKDVFMQTIVMKQEGSNLAKLVTKCRKGNHLDFKVSMFEKSHLEQVGGQLGAAPSSKTGSHLLLLGHEMTMKSDSEFKVEETWQSLGGSEEASVDLESKMQGEPAEMSTLQEACTEGATTMCAKYFPKDDHPEAFLNCVFDTCRGGDEADAATQAELLSA